MVQTEVIDGGLGDDYIEAGFYFDDSGPSTSGLVVNGGDGDDTLSSDGIGSEFNGGDGNDLIDVAVNDTVNGGTGNDTISSNGGAVVDGGTGDDVLTGDLGDTHFGGAGNDVLSGASSMSGGDGNDTISGDYELSGGDGDDVLTSYANPSAAGEGDAIGMSGDAGNDTLTASADIGYDNTPSVPGSYLSMSGGEGADVFDIQLDMSSPSHLSPSPTVPTQTSTYLNIADFDPAEDVLTVQINRDEEGADREMISAEIVGTQLQMTFAATETDGEHSASIWLGSSVDVSIEDIVFVAGPGIIIGQVLTIPNDGGDINGTDGNDTLISEISGNEDLYRNIDIGDIRLGDGDDLADVALYGGNIYGELGDDTIASSGIGGSLIGGDGDDLIESRNGLNLVEGGEGNDTLIGLEDDKMYGGTGDDVLTVETSQPWYAGVAEGGTGDDTISVHTYIGTDDLPYWIPSAIVVGDEGEDIFELQLNMRHQTLGDGSFSLSSTTALADINLVDFDPDEDSIVVQINRADGNEDREMTSAELVTTERESQGQLYTDYELVMEFAATDAIGAHTAVIELGSDMNLTFEDIVFVQN